MRECVGLSQVSVSIGAGLWLGNISPDASVIGTLYTFAQGQSVANFGYRMTLSQRGDVSTIGEG